MDSPHMQAPCLDLNLDSNTQRLLQSLDEEDDPEQVMETPLAALYSKIKERRKLGLKQLFEGKALPEFGILSPKRGKKSINEQLARDGEQVGQAKITDLWKVGKGSPLPEQK
ncbi:hypothetical protein SUGI_0249070 [Cryptomeria japonica]|nr:hypothetical protein SUGI_0249070 [Cryptomeria japonica]